MDSPVLGCGNPEGEGGLEGGLVPAGEAPARVGRDKKGYSRVTLFAILKQLKC